MYFLVQRENIWTIPNLLCVSRIALSPYLCHLVLAADHQWALGLFLLAGTTDLVCIGREKRAKEGS